VDRTEFERWMESAKRTLASARHDLTASSYNWACFKAHQAAEKAVKAVLWGLGYPRIGHSLNMLLRHAEALGIDVPRDVSGAALRLDKYYTITRCPDAWADGIPEDYFDRHEAEDAIRYAETIMRWAGEIWQELSRSA